MMLRLDCLVLYAAIGGLSCSSPAPLAEHGCLACHEAVERGDEALLCPGMEQAYWEGVLSCRCASGAPCFGLCDAWCVGGDAPPGPTCVSCTATLCADAGALCEAH